jgi:hypothetical protein
MMTDERRADIERAMQELDDARDAWLKGESRVVPILIGASRATEMARELLAEIARLNETLSSRAELAATTIAGLEMENARLKAECDTLRAAGRAAKAPR